MGEAVGPALRYRDVSKIYVRSHLGRATRTRGIEGLSLELPRGRAFGVLGLNGSGKTTTFKLALGLLAPTAGAVDVFGQPAGSTSARARMGYLPELPYFPPHLTPLETLGLFGRLSGLRGGELEERVARALERVGLGRHGGRRMADFSKGMLQRVGMAQALLHEPALLLLDEPASGLDPLAIADMRAVLVGLRASGASLLIASHSISEVERVCDEALILVDGRLARRVAAAEWSASAGRLEEIFVETIRGQGSAA